MSTISRSSVGDDWAGADAAGASVDAASGAGNDVVGEPVRTSTGARDDVGEYDGSGVGASDGNTPIEGVPVGGVTTPRVGAGLGAVVGDETGAVVGSGLGAGVGAGVGRPLGAGDGEKVLTTTDSTVADDIPPASRRRRLP